MQDLNLTKAQNLIVRRISQFHLQCLYRILNDETHTDIDIKLFLIQNDCDEDVFYETLLEDIAKFENLVDNPEDLRILDPSDLSKFRHLLANIKVKYQKKYPNAIRNLWERLYLIEDSKNIKTQAFSLN